MSHESAERWKEREVAEEMKKRQEHLVQGGLLLEQLIDWANENKGRR